MKQIKQQKSQEQQLATDRLDDLEQEHKAQDKVVVVVVVVVERTD